MFKTIESSPQYTFATCSTLLQNSVCSLLKNILQPNFEQSFNLQWERLNDRIQQNLKQRFNFERFNLRGNFSYNNSLLHVAYSLT